MTIPEVEIEIRLGCLNFNKFDSSIDKTYFEKILSSFNGYSNWKNIYVTNTIEYIKNNKKIVTYPDGTIYTILKENIYKKDFQLKNIPFDIRFSVNQELLTRKEELTLENVDQFMIRNKSRKTFEDSNFRYDLTYVTEVINNISKDKFEFEIELIINEETLEWSNQYLNDFLVCKVQDIVNLIEEKNTIIKNLVMIN
jgi:hypothetical protein